MDKIKWDLRTGLIIEGIFHYNTWWLKIIPRFVATVFGRHVFCQYCPEKVIFEISDYTTNGMHIVMMGNLRFIKHELVHVLQYNNRGFFNFLGSYIWQWIRHGFRYKRIDFEKEADLIAEKKQKGIIYVKAVK